MVLLVRDRIVSEFGRVWDAAGVRNFYGQGWRHSQILRWLGLDLSEVTFVSKTTTVEPRDGNTPLRKDLMTRDFFPQSVVVKFRGKHTLNAWGLSGPGAEVVLEELAKLAEARAFKILQISFMPVGTTQAERVTETRKFVVLLKRYLTRFKGIKLAVQFNASCPNTGHDLNAFRMGLDELLIIMMELELLILVKESVDTPFEPMRRLVEHPAVAGLVTTNCVKFGNLPDRIPWEKIFGAESPLNQYGGGGYSGPHLLPLVLARVQQYRDSGYAGHINAGGGLQTALDARRLHEAGADSVFVGATCVNYGPWRVRSIVRETRLWGAPEFSEPA